jgi:hypothetical protein
MEVVQMLSTLKASGDVEVVRGSLKLLEEMVAKLKTDGSLRTMLEKRIQNLKREELKLRLADEKKQNDEEDARRRRELAQFDELTKLLPMLVNGYDYSRALDMLESMKFASNEVNGALETKQYLYSRAQAFIDQLEADVKANPWRGVVRRLDGASAEGAVTGLSKTELILSVDRGTVPVALELVSPQTLAEMAMSYVEGVTDSTEYYRRQEQLAVFARLAGLETIAAMIAAPLMEENRDFRMRWLKVL